MPKQRKTCVQPVVTAWGILSTTNTTLPHVEFTNENLGTNRVVVTNQAPIFPTTSTQLIFANNSVEMIVIPTIHRTNNNDNKGY